MIILSYLFMVNQILPQVILFCCSLFEELLMIVILFTGIALLLSSIGIKSSAGLSQSIVTGIFGLLSILLSALIALCVWVIKYVLNLLPKIYRKNRRYFIGIGLSIFISNFLAAIVTLLVLIIII